MQRAEAARISTMYHSICCTRQVGTYQKESAAVRMANPEKRGGGGAVGAAPAAWIVEVGPITCCSQARLQ